MFPNILYYLHFPEFYPETFSNTIVIVFCTEMKSFPLIFRKMKETV